MTYLVTPATGRLVSVMTSFKVGASADIVQFDYDEYTLGGTPVTNARALIFGLSAGATF